ncbi:MAG: hypothetical protein WDM92_07475 [Caulobacteraceae bacterium]
MRAIESIARAGRAIAMMRLPPTARDKAVAKALGAAAARPAKPANDTEDPQMDEALTPDELADLERECRERLDRIAAKLERKRADSLGAHEAPLDRPGEADRL